VCKLVARPDTGQVFLMQGAVMWSWAGCAYGVPSGTQGWAVVGEAPSLYEWRRNPKLYGPVWLPIGTG
jgi:hypothetical protein